MAAYTNFRSSSQIDTERQELREARKKVLEKAKEDYDKSERRRERARQAGEGTWMLSSVTERIDREQKALEKAKKKKKKEKKKKKKHKKEKKKKRDSSSSESDSSDEEASWVEKTPQSTTARVSGPSLQRDTWMESPLVTDIIPTVTRDELRERKRGDEEKKKSEADRLLEQPGQHAKELNPYWKDGGVGLPQTPSVSDSRPSTAAPGDGGLSWLRKAYQRCQDQAKEEGRSLEEVVAERYGSLDKLTSMIREAENDSNPGSSRPRDKRLHRDDEQEKTRHHRDYHRRHHESPERQRSPKRRSPERRKSPDRRRSSERRRTPERRRFMKPPSDDNPGKSSSSSLRGRFARPESDEDEKPAVFSRDVGRREERRSSGGGGWKKKTQEEGRKEEERKHGHKRSVSSSSSESESSSGSESGKEEEKEEEEQRRKEKEAAASVKILSEDEMNSLGARILRAELMGDEDLAKELKTKLEQAQKAKEAAPKATAQNPGGGTKEKDKEEGVVVLTRTGRDGMVRPLPEQEYDRDRGSKKRRKLKNVGTHEKRGERTKYFDDDDRHDLKTLVEMEKLGTAEDQNAMFSRLAGRSTEKTDEDFQVDDMFLSKAARQQSGARNEEKERSKAIFEHRKVSAAMEKCQFCFNQVPKHLIISIGNKVYLCLPAHRSLTPGHCLIVPMSHSASATTMDEDVWQEMQTFRKTLVQMFNAQDQDIVFMETSMHLKRFPHTLLECVPVDREIGDMAPIYFKKAMLDAGPEWNSNKKVVDLSRKDIRHSVPKGFPYFSVDFGLQGGYAHVIEEENTFPSYFGREIVGGMIDAEPGLWRKPHRESFEDQRRKVLEFEQWWKPYDFTSAS